MSDKKIPVPGNEVTYKQLNTLLLSIILGGIGWLIVEVKTGYKEHIDEFQQVKEEVNYHGYQIDNLDSRVTPLEKWKERQQKKNIQKGSIEDY